MSSTVDRRTFMTVLTGVAAAHPLTELTAQAPSAQAARPSVEWNLAWLDQFKGKHKQPNNYLNTFRDVFHLEPPDVNVAVGIARTAFPINASDALWQKYKLGEGWKIQDPSTGKPAIRNVFLGPATGAGGVTVRGLHVRGVTFWQCNIALGGGASPASWRARRDRPSTRPNWTREATRPKA